MMKRYFSILLALVISTSIVGCGNANAKSDSANASNNVTVNNVQVESEKVSDISSPEVDNSVTAQEPQPTAESVSSGSLYTLPVGAKGEEWSEAQLDEYLKDCKAYQKASTPNSKGTIKFNLDDFMSEFGFEYVGTFEDKPAVSYNVYWTQVAGMKMIALFYIDDHLDIYIDNGSKTAVAMFGRFSSTDFTVNMISDYFGDDGRLDKTSMLYLKGISAVLKCVTSGSFDCARLPFPTNYLLDYSEAGSVHLKKGMQFKTDEVVFERSSVY